MKFKPAAFRVSGRFGRAPLGGLAHPASEVREVAPHHGRIVDLEGLLKTKQSVRDKDKRDRMVIERALAEFRRK